MGWFNAAGLIFLCVMMIPNVVFMLTHKDSFQNSYTNKIVVGLEQIARWGCFVLMIFNIPYTYYGFWFGGADLVYIIVGSSLVSLYILFWILFWSRHLLIRSYVLSIISSAFFIFSGIMLVNAPLLLFSLIFVFCHIMVTLKNAYGLKN